MHDSYILKPRSRRKPHAQVELLPLVLRRKVPAGRANRERLLPPIETFGADNSRFLRAPTISALKRGRNAAAKASLNHGHR
jgi:hypothetical protein